MCQLPPQPFGIIGYPINIPSTINTEELFALTCNEWTDNQAVFQLFACRKVFFRRNAQIDLIIERADRMVNICEIKYSSNSYLIDNEEYLRFQNRIARFQQETAYSGGIIPVFITPFGLQRNAYSEYIINCIVLDDLF
ncbi:MAG: hypothetical protein K6A94_02690 [Bacteroidales bacterium]|nr:hypothetical protein [Bacteroidales bacterium]